MLNLMNAVQRLGTPVDLLLNNPAIPELAQLASGIRILSLGHSHGLGRVPALTRYLLRDAPAALLVNREPAVRAATLARRLSGRRCPIAIRVGTQVSIALARRSLPKRLLLRLAMLYCYRRADLLIANSRGVAQDLAVVTGVALRTIRIIDNPTVSDSLFRLAAQPLDHPWFEPGEPPVILGIGRLARQKDFPTLLRAFARLRSQTPCRLMILGEGKERGLLTDMARELGIAPHLALPGFAPNPFPLLKRAALFVLSSAWEGSPNVLIEALALARPVVATDCPSGPREILRDGRYGPLVPVGDDRALTAAMAAVLASPPAASHLREAADRFRDERCARHYLAALKLPTGRRCDA
jgi:glycosyltransferase involved in cell wall biosynthesis